MRLFKRRSKPEPPAKKSKKRRLPKTISREEAARALATIDLGTDRGKRDYCIVLLMYRAGLRVSEVLSLKPRDVDLERGTIRILDGKGGDGTSYFDAGRVRPPLAAWLEVRPESPLLFCKPDGSRVIVRYVQRLVERMRAEAGIQGRLTPHVWRHTYATELLEDGFSIREVQEAVRHANIATTEVYLHVRDEQLREKMSQRGGR